MNDFLRPCSCVHPSEEDCEKCIQEAAPEMPARPCGCKGSGPHKPAGPAGRPAPAIPQGAGEKPPEQTE